jgi:hypothetical protein
MLLNSKNIFSFFLIISATSIVAMSTDIVLKETTTEKQIYNRDTNTLKIIRHRALTKSWTQDNKPYVYLDSPSSRDAHTNPEPIMYFIDLGTR